MWTPTHFYKFPDEAAFLALPPHPPAAIDVVGTVYNTRNPEAPVLVPGYHVNVRWWAQMGEPEPADWAPYRMPTPNFPKREFA